MPAASRSDDPEVILDDVATGFQGLRIGLVIVSSTLIVIFLIFMIFTTQDTFFKFSSGLILLILITANLIVLFSPSEMAELHDAHELHERVIDIY